MQDATKNTLLTSRTVYLIILIHVAFWTLVPTLVNSNLPLDTIEALAWGDAWQLGYDKHPPLSAWLLEVAAIVGFRTDLAIYFLSQLFVGLSLLLTYKLSREWLNENQSAVATLILTGLWCYTYSSPEFNVNIAQMPCWVGGIFAFWRAIQTGRLGWWMLLGFCSAMAVLSKYLGGLMLVPMFAYALWHPQRRRIALSAGPYVAAITFVLLLLPHLLWMIDTDFATIRYGFKRAGLASMDAAQQSTSSVLDHVVNPLEFLAEQAGIVSSAVVLFLFSKPRRASRIAPEGGEASIQQPAKEARVFITVMALGPFVVLAIISLAIGADIRSMWTTPMVSMVGTLLSMHYTSTRTRAAERQFLLAVAIVMSTLLIAYTSTNLYARLNPTDGKRTTYPGNQFADDLTSQWRERFGTPLRIVIGDEWYGGNICWYSPDRPTLYHSADTRLSPWVDDEDVRRFGAVALWRVLQDKSGQPLPVDAFENELIKRFPNIIMLPPPQLQWNQRATNQPMPVKAAFIPPQASAP